MNRELTSNPGLNPNQGLNWNRNRQNQGLNWVGFTSNLGWNPIMD